MPPPKPRSQVFIESVEDILHGDPYARHPVQFADTGVVGTVACTLCGSLVADTEEWRATHRQNHDDHNRVHGDIEEEARRYKSPPTYG